MPDLRPAQPAQPAQGPRAATMIRRLTLTLALIVLLLPVALGLLGTLLPALGLMPAIGERRLSLKALEALFGAPGFATALTLSIWTGVGASVVSLLLAFALVVSATGLGVSRRMEALILPLLASPHAALAIGLAFLIQPSGFLARLLSPWATGWSRPPVGLVTVNDPLGLSMILGLVLKETPFLIVMIAAGLSLVPYRERLRAAEALGYPRAQAFLGIVAPAVWPTVRLPFYAVLAYAAGNVDQALVLGPGSPGTLSVMIVRWFSDYDLSLYPAASAGALVLGLATAVLIGLARALETPAFALVTAWATSGRRSPASTFAVNALAILGTLALGLGLVALALNLVWSLAGDWPFPLAFPADLTASTWAKLPERAGGLIATSLTLALSATLLALVLAVLGLELLDRIGDRRGVPLTLVYLPLIVPLIAFLFGLEVAFVAARIDGSWAALVIAHLVIVLPYVLIALDRSWTALNPRYALTSASLGKGPWATLFKVKLPLLARPLALAAATGFAVSLGQYLPTVVAGGGRHPTLTTEAITLASGGDRRLVAMLGALQTALPLLAFALALAVPAALSTQRRRS